MKKVTSSSAPQLGRLSEFHTDPEAHLKPAMTKTVLGLWLASCLALSLTSTGLTGCASTPEKRSTGEYIDDQSLIVRVKKALGENAEYKFSNVTVTSYRGTVQLGGFVEQNGQKQKAEEIAAKVDGVKKVENNILVKS